jgi:hypothetical protein
MVAVFDPLAKMREGLTPDRDSAKRDEKIMTVLRERGAFLRYCMAGAEDFTEI